MLYVSYYILLFGAPLVGYFIWRRFLRKQLGFLFLLPLIITLSWLASWPLHNSQLDSAQDRDVAINGYVFLGWFPPLIGCLPIVILDAVLSLAEWIKKRQQNELAFKNESKGAPNAERSAEQGRARTTGE